MSLPSESLEVLRRAAAVRADVARLVLVELHVEPRSEEPFDVVKLVVVLDDPPSEPEPARTRELLRLLAPALGDASGCSIVIPSAAGMDAATRGGAVVYERAEA